MNEQEAATEVVSLSDGHWEWLITSVDPPYDITGKYLFFSSDRDLLVEIARQVLSTGVFHHAKIPLPGKNLSDEYVLCLYYKDDSMKHQLAKKYSKRQGLRYRYWKSEETTRKGQYSDQFLRSLNPEDRAHFKGE